MIGQLSSGKPPHFFLLLGNLENRWKDDYDKVDDEDDET